MNTKENQSSLGAVATSGTGAVAGLAGSVATVSAAGSVGGLGAAGITSGLAAIGSVAGGGMLAGLCVVAAVPVAAAGLSYLGYKYYKKITQ